MTGPSCGFHGALLPKRSTASLTDSKGTEVSTSHLRPLFASFAAAAPAPEEVEAARVSGGAAPLTTSIGEEPEASYDNAFFSFASFSSSSFYSVLFFSFSSVSRDRSSRSERVAEPQTEGRGKRWAFVWKCHLYVRACSYFS